MKANKLGQLCLLVFALSLMVPHACAQSPISLPSRFFVSQHPTTPPQDSLENLCSVSIESLTRVKGNIDQYLRKGKVFTGWACHIDPNNDHRYRYMLIEQGRLLWQVGYYANGNRDFDFRLKNGKSMGSEGMWMADGWPYVENFYSAPGVLHGIQRRWYGNHQIAMKSMYDHGEMIYKVEWDREGNFTRKEGKVPANFLE